MLLDWLIDYLLDRSITVVVGGQISIPHDITAGVPQGDLLGPILFLLCINDAEYHLPQFVGLAGYADNKTLFQCLTAMENNDQSSAVFQNAVDILEAWETSWRIAFEPSKSQAMTIDPHRPPWHVLPQEFAGVPITEETHLKLLGVTFDCQLSCRRRLHAVTKRASQRIGLLRKASLLLDPRSRQTVNCGFVRPVMEYCPLVLMGAADCHLRQLDQTQRSALQPIGPRALLHSLSIRRMVAACTFF